jgi:hypothetical protein
VSDTSITTADDKLCSGCGFPLGGSRLGIIGVPGTFHADCLPHASTAALLATARAEARKAALEEAVKLADERGAATTASAIRALIEKEG